MGIQVEGIMWFIECWEKRRVIVEKNLIVQGKI